MTQVPSCCLQTEEVPFQSLPIELLWHELQKLPPTVPGMVLQGVQDTHRVGLGWWLLSVSKVPGEPKNLTASLPQAIAQS